MSETLYQELDTMGRCDPQLIPNLDPYPEELISDTPQGKVVLPDHHLLASRTPCHSPDSVHPQSVGCLSAMECWWLRGKHTAYKPAV
jgi:hypothetical protein